MMSTARAKDRAKVGARIERFAGHDGNAAPAPDVGERLDILGLTGLLEPVGLEFRQRVSQVDGVHRRQTPMNIEQDVDVRTDRVADCAQHLRRTPDVVLGNERSPRARNGIELQRGEAALQDGFCSTSIIFRLLHLVAPAVRIDADAGAAGAADEVVDRLLRGFADNVPQGLLDAGGRAMELERAAPLGVVVKRDLQEVAQLEGVAPDEITAELLDLRGDGAVAIVLAVRLAPADDPGIGRDAHENEILSPPGMDRKALDAGDFHGRSIRPFCGSI